jgi:DNA-binding NarL/FixJ family response regulator
LELSDVERQTLLSWSRRAKTAQALALRARIVLACADGAANKDVAAALGVWPQTVTNPATRCCDLSGGGSLSGRARW